MLNMSVKMGDASERMILKMRKGTPSLDRRIRSAHASSNGAPAEAGPCSARSVRGYIVLLQRAAVGLQLPRYREGRWRRYLGVGAGFCLLSLPTRKAPFNCRMSAGEYY